MIVSGWIHVTKTPKKRTGEEGEQEEEEEEEEELAPVTLFLNRSMSESSALGALQ